MHSTKPKHSIFNLKSHIPSTSLVLDLGLGRDVPRPPPRLGLGHVENAVLVVIVVIVVAGAVVPVDRLLGDLLGRLALLLKVLLVRLGQQFGHAVGGRVSAAEGAADGARDGGGASRDLAGLGGGDGRGWLLLLGGGQRVQAVAVALDVGAGPVHERLHGVGEGHVARGLVLGDVAAVLVLDAEAGPHAAAEDLGEGDEEGAERRVLPVVGEDGVEDPGEPDDRVEDYDGVVGPSLLQGEDVS